MATLPMDPTIGCCSNGFKRNISNGVALVSDYVSFNYVFFFGQFVTVAVNKWKTAVSLNWITFNCLFGCGLKRNNK